MNWDGVKVLITGAGGFIGSHLCERLVAEGGTVRAFVRYNSRNDPGLLRNVDESVLREIEIVAGDLRDADAVRRAADGREIILHLGALVGIPYSYRNPREVIDVNVLGTLNVLEAARWAETRRVVHTSTSEVYGTAQTERIGEDHPLQGQSPYSASKIAADKIAESFHRAFGLPVVTIRPFNTYGPRQSRRAVIPTIVYQALKGGTIKLGTLDAVRDYTFVADTVEGMLLGASTSGVEGEEIHLGSDNETTVRELVVRIGKIVKRELTPSVESERLRPENSEVMRLRSNNARAAERLGWRPCVGLDEGLARVVQFAQERAESENRVDRYEV